MFDTIGNQKDKKGLCKECKHEITARDGCTSSLWRHVSQHPKEWALIEEKYKSLAKPKVQPRITACVENSPTIKYPLTSVKRKNLNKKLVGMIVKDLRVN